MMKKACLKLVSLLLIVGLIFSSFAPQVVEAVVTQDDNAGSWTDPFADEDGLSASAGTGASGGEIVLDSTTPGAMVETAQADFTEGTLSQIDVQTTAGSILLESGNYTESQGANGYTAVGTAKSWQGDDAAYEYSLPFSFSYYGTSYSTVWVSTNGYIHFDSNYDDYIPTRDKLKSNKMIAPFWADLNTGGLAQSGEDIYIQENADNVVIRWVGETVLDEKPVNFSLQLNDDGVFKFHYGTGTGMAAASTYQREIGASEGDEVSWVVSELDDDADLSSAQTSTFTYTSGYLSPGTFTSQEFDGYDNSSNKTAVSIELVTGVLPASTSVKVEYSVNGGSGYATAGTYSTTGGTGITYTGLSGSGTSLRYKLTLTGTTSATPEVQSITYNYTLSSSLVETVSEDFIDGTLSNVDAGLTQDQVELSKKIVTETLGNRENIATGSAQSFISDDENLLYSLPFPFSFYGTDYTQVRINTNGYLVFDEDYNSFVANATNLGAHKIIAPLWADLRTNGSTQTGEDVYIQDNGTSVEIYWKAQFWETDGVVNFSVQLFDTGAIEFHYGTGNTGLGSITHIVGVSKGDSSTSIESDLSDDSSLHLAQTSTINYTSDRESSGTWTSPTYDAGSGTRDKLWQSIVWSKTAPADTTISLEYDIDAAGSWSTPPNTTGSITIPAGTTGKSIRYRVNFDRTNGETATPTLEDITLSYISYESSGTAISENIDPGTGPVEWETVSFNETTTATDTLTVDVLDTSNNLLLEDVSTGDSLTSIDVNTYTAIRLRANLATTNQGLTSSLQDWTVNWDPRIPTVIGATDFGAPVSGNLSVVWTATDDDTGTADLDSNPIDIFYSDDGGTNYIQIVNDIADSSPYSWDTTKVADDTDYKIKITARDGYDMEGSQASPSGTFEIGNYSGSPNAPSVSISAPGTGVTWTGSETISWSASDADSDLKVNPINLFYSTNDADWYLIAADEGNDGSYSWDTTTVADGSSYKVKVRAFDEEGRVGEAISGTFAIDNVGPTFTVEYYSDSDLTTALPTLASVSQVKAETIYLKITASESLQSTPTFGVDQQGSEDVSNQSTTLVSGNIYKGSYTVNTDTGGTYKDGIATTSLSGTDDNGNNGTVVSSGGTFNIDTAVPSAPTISSPSDNTTYVSTTGTISVSGTAEVDSTVTVTVGGTDYTITASGNGTYSRGSITLSGGSEALSVKATDASNNDSSSTSITVKLNRKPVVSISSPTSSSLFSGTSNSISWTATDADSDSLTYTVDYSANGGSTWINLAAAGYTSTSYSWNVTALSDGTDYKVRVIADDGTETTTANSNSFGIYDDKPTVTISDIDKTNDTTPTFTGTATSTTSTISMIKYRLGSGSWTELDAGDGTYNEASEDYSFTLSTLAVGTYTVYAKARDANHYYSDEVSDSFTIETTEPETPSITSPANGAIFDPTDDTNGSLTGTQITVIGTAEAGVTVKLHLNDDHIKSVTVDADGDWVFYNVTLVLGENKLKVVAVDAAGNSSGGAEVKVTYVTDKDAPLVVLNPFGQNPTNDNTPLLTGTVKESGSKVLKLEYSHDGGSSWLDSGFWWGNVTEFTFAFESEELEDGVHVFQVRAKDKEEKIGESAKRSLRIDTTAPYIGGSLIVWNGQYLLPDEDGVIEVALGAELDLIVALAGEDMVRSQLRVGKRRLDLEYSAAVKLWLASFEVEGDEQQQLVVSVEDELGNVSERLIATMITNPGGYVYEVKTKDRVEGAKVNLWYFEETAQEWVSWDAKAYGQENPVMTGEDGSYSFMVTPGKYYLTVEKDGYALFNSQVMRAERNRLISVNVGLVSENLVTKAEEAVPAEAVFGVGTIGLLALLQILARRLLWLA